METVIAAGPEPVTIEVSCPVMLQACHLQGQPDVEHHHARCNVCGELGVTIVTDSRPEWSEGEGFLSCCFCGIGG